MARKKTLPDFDETAAHACAWKTEAERLRAEVLELSKRLAEVERRAKNDGSERRKLKLPPPVPPRRATPEETAARRGEQAAARAALGVEEVPTPLPVPDRKCPEHGASTMKPAGQKTSEEIQYVAAHVRRRVYVRETWACSKCDHIVTAKGPLRIGEKTRYARSFVAYLMVSKCDHSMPQHRLERELADLGVPVSRSTMCGLVHRGSAELVPLYERLVKMLLKEPVVHADETSHRQQGRDERVFYWTFVAPSFTVYKYATDRSGKTPESVLGSSEGFLVVDGYTGYNAVTGTGKRKRERGGCNAHAGRKLFETERDEAQDPLDLYGVVYEVEREAKDRGIVGTAEHLEMRRARSRPALAKLLLLVRQIALDEEPRSKLGKAVRYLLRQRKALTLFTRHANVSPDNNIAESSLRRIAMGRSNFIFLGSERAGHSFAVIYSLVASCRQNGKNPTAYLTDVLTRVQTHPASRIDELLPMNWVPSARRRDGPVDDWLSACALRPALSRGGGRGGRRRLSYG